MDDSVSNMVRVSRLPFCHDVAAFLRVILMIGRLAAGCARGAESHCHLGQRRAKVARLRFWEVGANLGDCTLWTAAMLSSPGPGQPLPLVQLDATAFEPVPLAAAAFRRSAAALVASVAAGTTGHADAALPRIRVRELALSDRVGTHVLGVPKHSMAETSGNDCTGQYGNTSCNDMEVATGSVDRLLARSRAAYRGRYRRRGGKEAPMVIDLMKVHVQGDELKLLRGASSSLASGLVCVLVLKVYSIQLARASAAAMATEICQHLRSYKAVLVGMDGEASPLDPSGQRLVELIEGARRTGPLGCGGAVRQYNHMLVAWHRGHLCAGSLAVAAVRRLWDIGDKVAQDQPNRAST